MKYLKYFEKKLSPNFSHYLYPVDEENNWMFDSFDYLLKLNTEPKIFDMKNIFLSDFSDKKYAIYFKYKKGVPTFMLNRAITVTDEEFEKYNLIRNELKEKEALQYSLNKKYNL